MSREEIGWHEPTGPRAPGPGFAFSRPVIDSDYTSRYTAKLARIGPGGKSTPHVDPHNHAFYFVSGTGRVQIRKQSWDLAAGTIVKIPQGVPHALENTGAEDLVFLVIFDPPHVARGPVDQREPLPADEQGT